MTGFIQQWLAHPLTRGIDIDDPQTTVLRGQIIRSKPFLKKLYEEWYRVISAHFPSNAMVLELGSGAGFLKEFIPQLITSELFPAPGVARVIDAQAIAMPEASLDGIVMTDVLHHIPDCSSFFYEAARVIRPGGRIVMIEPWNTAWSRWIFRHLHHEPFEPDAREWRIIIYLLIWSLDFQKRLEKTEHNESDEIDHSLALKVADEIIRIQRNLSNMDPDIKGLKQLEFAVERIQDNFRERGYVMVELLHKTYDQGMKVSAKFKLDVTLGQGEQIITRIIKPHSCLGLTPIMKFLAGAVRELPYGRTFTVNQQHKTMPFWMRTA